MADNAGLRTAVILLDVEFDLSRRHCLRIRIVKIRLLTLATAALLLGCGPASNKATPEKPFISAADLGEQARLSNAQNLALPEFAEANIERGGQLFGQCRGCHGVDDGGMNLLGPNLYGVFRHKAGGNDKFGYTQALSTARFYWTPQALDGWLLNPSRFLPGNAMSFMGILNPDDRRDLIAWLLTVTASPEAESANN